MKNYDIYYYHPLELTFKSAQTLQVIKDYTYLSKLGYRVFLFGKIKSKEELSEIKKFISGTDIKILTNSNNMINKLLFIFSLFRNKNRKIILTRHYRKFSEIKKLSFLFNKVLFFHEMHEEAFPYLFKKNISKENTKKLFNNIDALIFTNQSQVDFYKKEFGELPEKYEVLYNAVEIEKFKNAEFKDNKVITYLGQFNTWKNVELIFSSLSHLDESFTLRIAGGKNDSSSKEFIDNLISKYNLKPKRIEYLGFIKNDEIVEKVLTNTNVLVIPLGDNIQSKYLTSPMKLFEYMSTNIPVVCVDYPTITSIVSDNEVYLSRNDAKEFASKIKEASENKDLSKINNMNNLIKEFSYEKRSLKFSKFIKDNYNEYF